MTKKPAINYKLDLIPCSLLRYCTLFVILKMSVTKWWICRIPRSLLRFGRQIQDIFFDFILSLFYFILFTNFYWL